MPSMAHLKISYDWRGMPVEFMQYPPLENTGVSGDTLFRLTVAYDGTGRRISKTRWVKARGDEGWSRGHVTHYTGIGTEIRENYAGPAKQTKVVVKSLQGECRKNKLACSYDRAAAADAGGVNMSQGLGRYGIEDAERPDFDGMTGDGLIGYIPNTKFEWYLKNHLGSTMLVYGTVASTNPNEADVGEKIAAYDYRSFGEMVELTPPPTDKVTENFTGKEHDDEIALDYFGARYLDPMLGMWISVDPMRQFASPYLYAGNGYNPMNAVDPDGNDVQIQNEQASILEMINKASYNQYELDGNTLVEGSTCYEKGNAYFSERMDAAIYSDNVITAEMDPTNTDAINGGEGITYMTGDYGMPGANAQIVITGRPYGNSSAAQNIVHEFVSHAIPFILGDRKPNASAVSEEMKAIDGVFPPPNNVSDHPIY